MMKLPPRPAIVRQLRETLSLGFAYGSRRRYTGSRSPLKQKSRASRCMLKFSRIDIAAASRGSRYPHRKAASWTSGTASQVASRRAGRAASSAISSVHTSNRASTCWPKLLVKATSAASRP